ncbi:hypothetical protein BGW39_002612 [Mortierella sp. 14UC]|nr:hypothetical protein BGW39_002612 [Mortierella sp. 14UC]
MSFTYTPAPVVVTLPRPKCFCGYTSVAVYQDPVTASSSSSSSGPAGPVGQKDPGSPPLLKSNWVYECHFTPKQRGMVKPDLCNDCEEARRPRVPSQTSDPMSGNATTEQDLAQTSLHADIPASTTTATNRGLRQHKLHIAPHYDKVELWPRPTPAPSPFLDHQDHPSDKDTVIGAQISQPSTFHGLSPLDHLRVCGFHMHALEWHHMQTLEVEQILALAKRTGCAVFNLSVVRWLGEHIRRKTKSPNTNTSRTITAGTVVGDKDRGKDAMWMIKGMDFTLFHKMGCLCKKEAALVKAPAPTGSNASSTGFNRRGTSAASTQNERQLWIVCRARAQAKSSFEILDGGGEDSNSNRQMPGWHASASTITSGSGYGSSKRGRKVTAASGVGTGIGENAQVCSFGIPLEIANFGYNRAPIHGKIENNAWLSQWLSPPSHARPLALSASLKRAISAVKESISTVRHSPPPADSPTHEKRTTVRYLEHNGWPWSTPFLYNEGNEEQDGKDHMNGIHNIDQRYVGWDTGLPRVKQEPKKDNRARDMKRLDKELQEVLARHVEVLRPKIAAHGEGQLKEIQEDELGSRFYKRIDMDTISTVRLQLCEDCSDGVREFCVMRRHRSQHYYPPPSPSLTPSPSAGSLDLLIQLDVDMDRDMDIGSKPEAQVDLELEHIDKELENIMSRHAEQVQRNMEARSWLFPFFLQCRSCELRQRDVDVIPCSHEFLCGQCLDRVEFYVVPRNAQ